MLTQLLTGPRAWRARTIDAPPAWYHRLSPRCRAALDETVRRLRRQPRCAIDLRAAEEPCADCAGELRPVLADLEEGRGFAVVEGPTPDEYSPEEMQAAYWLVGQLLSTPIAQNVQGTLLYDVRDTGQDVRYGARFSVTNAESTFHTDNSFGHRVVDYVGLLCIRAARAGGLSQVVSGQSAHNELLARDPEALAALYRPMHFDRRGGVRPGEEPTARHPVLRWDGRGLVYRYLRYWIEAGHEKAGRPLTPEQRRALDVLDEVLRDPGLRAEFALKPGDMFFVNNRWILHNRTAFEDDGPQRRHLVRLWFRGDR